MPTGGATGANPLRTRHAVQGSRAGGGKADGGVLAQPSLPPPTRLPPYQGPRSPSFADTQHEVATIMRSPALARRQSRSERNPIVNRIWCDLGVYIARIAPNAQRNITSIDGTYYIVITYLIVISPAFVCHDGVLPADVAAERNHRGAAQGARRLFQPEQRAVAQFIRHRPTIRRAHSVRRWRNAVRPRQSAGDCRPATRGRSRPG